MKKLTREMLIIEPTDNEQYCDTCPFSQERQTCLRGEINYDLCNNIGFEFNKGVLICTTNSITLKPEYNGAD